MAHEAPPGRRTTRQLALVLEAVQGSGIEHPTAERIFRQVRRALPNISLGTVYRNLQRLVADGRISVAPLGARVVRYDPTPGPHDHFVCQVCGRIEDVAAGTPTVGVRAARRAGHEVKSHALVLYGRCRACRGAR
jgi:Fur family peroxide stress response transcriptional regulator